MDIEIAAIGRNADYRTCENVKLTMRSENPNQAAFIRSLWAFMNDTDTDEDMERLHFQIFGEHDCCPSKKTPAQAE